MLGRRGLLEDFAVPNPSPDRLSFVSSGTADADAAAARLRARYGDVGTDKAEIVVALGGDGLMLQALREVMARHVPVSGTNCGSVGFLMNDYSDDTLRERRAAAKPTHITPLEMQVTDVTGAHHVALALNEVSLFRTSYQAVKVEIIVDGKTQMDELICDGILLSTPAGSTAYNLSAHGPILPIDAALLALTPISAFRPRRWRGALLPHRAKVRFEIRESAKRPVSAVADDLEVRDVSAVDISEDRSIAMTMLYDAGHNLDERILAEQFSD